MKRLLLLISFATTLLVGVTLAQSGGGFDVRWYTISSGGTTMQGDTYTLGGTIGQPAAGGTLKGGSYALDGGYWSAATMPRYTIHLPHVAR